MFDLLWARIGSWFFKKELRGLILKERSLDDEIGRRVAQALAQMDPFEPLMREYGSIFSDEYERMEEKLNPQSQMQLMMWGYRQKDDPSFKYFMDWCINTYAQAAIKKGHPTPETILYGRAQISAPILMKKEVSRLALLYEDLLRKQKGEEFDADLSVE